MTQNLQTLQTRIAQMNIHDRGIFTQLLGEVLAGVPDKAYFLCENYDISVDTAQRWISGQVVPADEFRKLILRGIAKKQLNDSVANQ